MADESPSRARHGEAFWRAHHEAWRRSELNQREYCEAQGIPLKAFGNCGRSSRSSRSRLNASCSSPCRMASSRASMAGYAMSASTSTCSVASPKRDRSSKHGGSTTTPTDRTRALTGLHRLSSQHAPHQGITGTDSPYKRGQVGEQVTGSVRN